jgi:hypothetical protein
METGFCDKYQLVSEGLDKKLLEFKIMNKITILGLINSLFYLHLKREVLMRPMISALDTKGI